MGLPSPLALSPTCVLSDTDSLYLLNLQPLVGMLFSSPPFYPEPDKPDLQDGSDGGFFLDPCTFPGCPAFFLTFLLSFLPLPLLPSFLSPFFLLEIYLFYVYE